MDRILTVSIIGCGARGCYAYGPNLFNAKERFKIVALCDIIPEKVERFGELWDIPKASRFTDEDTFFAEKRSDIVLIATQDKDHVRMGLKALALGYDIMMEKPISDDEGELYALLEAQKKYGGKILVCHVLRYAPAFVKVKELLDSGVIGELKLMESTEQVAYWHQAHSYVRGNWRKEADSSPMIMAKSCHDLDLLQYYADSACESVYSVGDLSFFNKAHQPEGASDKCKTCALLHTCPYSAERIYVEYWKSLGCPDNAWPFNVLTQDVPHTEEKIRAAYENSGYGKCVFACDNDVVDNQYVTMLFKNGVKASFTMTGLTKDMGRIMTFHGTMGTIKFDEAEDIIKVQPYGKTEEVIKISTLINPDSVSSYGHGGGDYMLMDDLYKMVTQKAECSTTLEKSVESHLMALAAEKSRKTGKVVKVHE